MSAPQHTPGPWAAEIHPETPEHLPSAEIRGPARPYRGRSYRDHIATVLADWNTHGEWEANARLIAAAPHMLATLRAIVEQVSDPANGAHTLAAFKLGANIAEACAAIAKAEGRS